MKNEKYRLHLEVNSEKLIVPNTGSHQNETSPQGR